MSRTTRHGGVRDGRKYAPGTRNNARGYRHKVARQPNGKREWDDIWSDRRSNNSVIRSAQAREMVQIERSWEDDVPPMHDHDSGFDCALCEQIETMEGFDCD